MSDYRWCHGPNCHTRVTRDRVRGSKGSKVLRTRNIKQTEWNARQYWSHFCSTGWWQDFIITHWEQFINLHPRHEALETPIDDPKKVEHEGWNGNTYTRTEITKKEFDNNEQIG